jgi:ketosteroid isomerase-like protein
MSGDDRLQRLEDRESIWQLFMDYRRSFDRGDFHTYAQLYAEDGELILIPPVPTSAGDVDRVQGRAAIEALMNETMTSASLASDLTQHLVNNAEIELDGDTARSESAWCYVRYAADGGPVLSAMGRYVDVLVRTPEGWRFARREVHRDTPVV